MHSGMFCSLASSSMVMQRDGIAYGPLMFPGAHLLDSGTATMLGSYIAGPNSFGDLCCERPLGPLNRLEKQYKQTHCLVAPRPGLRGQ